MFQQDSAVRRCSGFVPIRFGVVFTLNMQIGFLSPPFGTAAFHFTSVAPAEIPLTNMFRGFLPFICIPLPAFAILLAWPGITQVFLR